MHFIYTLSDPRTGRVRYIGKTKTPKRRLSDHVNYPCSGGMKRWITELVSLNLIPIMDLIESCNGDAWIERERFHVSDYRLRFNDLLNVRKGGGGPLDSTYTEELRLRMSKNKTGTKQSEAWILKMKLRKASPETRMKMREAQLGKKHSEETLSKLRGRKKSKSHLKKLAKSNRGKKRSKESKERMRLAQLGKTLSLEHRQKIGAAGIGRVVLPETREKIRRAVIARHAKERLSRLQARKHAASLST